MKKALKALVCCFILLLYLSATAYALSTRQEQSMAPGVRIFNSLDELTKNALSQIGINASDPAGSFLSLSPKKVLSALWGFLQTDMASLSGQFGVMLGLIVLKALSDTLGLGSKTSQTAGAVSMLVLLFVVVSFTSQLITDCRACIMLTGDFMLVLIPVFAGVVAFAGKPQLALCFNTLAFGFAQAVSALFGNTMPALAGISVALSSAAALNPLPGVSSVAEAVIKWTVRLMGFVSALFTAVLTVRGVIAGAADTVTVKGLRYLVGSAVPVVGSALGDALTSAIAGLKLMSGGIGALGIAAVAVINLPVLIRLWCVRMMLSLCACFSEMWQMKSVTGFFKDMNACLSLFTAVIFFNMFVFIIACAIVITLQGMG